MAYAIVYSSKGGNTKLVAEALADALREAGAEVACCADAAEADASALAAADAVLAGFWTDKGDCTPQMAAVLEGFAGKRVFLFGTAGFGGSPEYFERIADRVRGHLPADADYLGFAMCQGKMGPGVRARYEAMLAENPDDKRAQAMIENFDAAASHPDDADLARIIAVAQSALGV